MLIIAAEITRNEFLIFPDPKKMQREFPNRTDLESDQGISGRFIPLFGLTFRAFFGYMGSRPGMFALETGNHFNNHTYQIPDRFKRINTS
jgi:hypothetical protein